MAVSEDEIPVVCLRVVDTVWDDLAIGECWEVVVVCLGLSFTEHLPASFEVLALQATRGRAANEFLLLCVYAKHGNAFLCAVFPRLLYFSELRVAALHGLHGQVFLEGTAFVTEFIKYLFDYVSRCVNSSLMKLFPNTLMTSFRLIQFEVIINILWITKVMRIGL